MVAATVQQLCPALKKGQEGHGMLPRRTETNVLREEFELSYRRPQYFHCLFELMITSKLHLTF
jgi:hypothetical protein